jgi:hypothetical protein
MPGKWPQLGLTLYIYLRKTLSLHLKSNPRGRNQFFRLLLNGGQVPYSGSCNQYFLNFN